MKYFLFGVLLGVVFLSAFVGTVTFLEHIEEHSCKV